MSIRLYILIAFSVILTFAGAEAETIQKTWDDFAHEEIIPEGTVIVYSGSELDVVNISLLSLKESEGSVKYGIDDVMEAEEFVQNGTWCSIYNSVGSHEIIISFDSIMQAHRECLPAVFTNGKYDFPFLLGKITKRNGNLTVEKYLILRYALNIKKRECKYTYNYYDYNIGDFDENSCFVLRYELDGCGAVTINECGYENYFHTENPIITSRPLGLEILENEYVEYISVFPPPATCWKLTSLAIMTEWFCQSMFTLSTI